MKPQMPPLTSKHIYKVSAPSSIAMQTGARGIVAPELLENLICC